MTTRSLDSILSVLTVSPAPEHLEIIGKNLPTCEQVILCLLALRNILTVVFCIYEAPAVVAEQVIKHFEKADIKTLSKPLDLQENKKPP